VLFSNGRTATIGPRETVTGAGKAIDTRFLLWFNGNGVVEKYWIPTETGPDYLLTPCLTPLAPFRNDVHIITGLDNPSARMPGPGNDHHRSMSSLVSGTSFTGRGAGGPSIDQVIAARIGGETRFRSLQIGDVVSWIALPQIVLVPAMAWVLRYLDARLLLTVGLATIAVGSWMNTGLTHDWAGDDFLPSQLVEAVGLALGSASLVTFGVANMRPAWAITIAGLIQTGRLLGNEIGSAFIQTFVRIQEQVTSNLTGLHLQTGADLTEQRTAQLSQLFGDRASSLGHSTGEAFLTLDNLVRREAYVLAYIDAFWIVAWVLTAGLVLLVFLRPPPPNHLTPPRLRSD